MSDITTDDLLAAIQAAARNGVDAEGSTVHELMERSGLSEMLVRRGLRHMLAQGRAVVVRLQRQRMNGIGCQVTGYRML